QRLSVLDHPLLVGDPGNVPLHDPRHGGVERLLDVPELVDLLLAALVQDELMGHRSPFPHRTHHWFDRRIIPRLCRGCTLSGECLSGSLFYIRFAVRELRRPALLHRRGDRWQTPANYPAEVV